MENQPVIIVAPQHDAYSETFINNHIRYLPNVLTSVYKLGNDAHFRDKTPLLSQSWLARLVRYINRSMYATTLQQQEADSVAKIAQRTGSCILAEYGPTASLLVKACSKRKVPLVVHFHGYDAYQYRTLSRHQTAYRQLFSYAKTIVVVSKDMQRQLHKLGAPDYKVKLIPYGIDMKQFCPDHSHSNRIHFLAVGRFVEKKAHVLTILAFKQLVEQVKGATLTIVGSGPLESTCKQVVTSLDLQKSVVFKGVMSSSDVALLMQQAFCFVQHSIVPEDGDSEGTPLAILEASASGLPVISTRHGGISDAVVHGKTGYLVNEGDTESMAQYMIKLSRDKNLARTLGKNGRQHIEKRYNLEDKIADLWKVVQA